MVKIRPEVLKRKPSVIPTIKLYIYKVPSMILLLERISMHRYLVWSFTTLQNPKVMIIWGSNSSCQYWCALALGWWLVLYLIDLSALGCVWNHKYNFFHIRLYGLSITSLSTYVISYHIFMHLQSYIILHLSVFFRSSVISGIHI